ncbi:MAG: hypothetical protein P4L90_00075 [Rhodopila sp.]|nr:hypothetical protein [Rhodopila sp.]
MSEPVPTSIHGHGSAKYPGAAPSPTDVRLAAKLAALRQEHGWPLDELADRSGISRAAGRGLEHHVIMLCGRLDLS